MRNQNQSPSQVRLPANSALYRSHAQTKPEDFFPRTIWSPDDYDFNDLKKKKSTVQFFTDEEKSQGKIDKTSDGWTSETMDNFTWDGAQPRRRRFAPKKSPGFSGQFTDPLIATNLTSSDFKKYLPSQKNLKKAENKSGEDLTLSNGNLSNSQTPSAMPEAYINSPQESNALSQPPPTFGNKQDFAKHSMTRDSKMVVAGSNTISPAETSNRESVLGLHGKCYFPEKQQAPKHFSPSITENRPPFCCYGAANVKPTVGGIIYGNYLKTFNANPQKGSNAPSSGQIYKTTELGFNRLEAKKQASSHFFNRSRSPSSQPHEIYPDSKLYSSVGLPSKKDYKLVANPIDPSQGLTLIPKLPMNQNSQTRFSSARAPTLEALKNNIQGGYYRFVNDGEASEKIEKKEKENLIYASLFPPEDEE